LFGVFLEGRWGCFEVFLSIPFKLVLFLFISTGYRYAPAERPDLAALQTTVTDNIYLLMRKPDQRIEAELAAIPPLAVPCSLKDIVPKNAVSNSCFYY